MSKMNTARSRERNLMDMPRAVWLAGAIIALAFAYWSIFPVMLNKWAHDPQYSHGYLVPAFCLGLLWLRRDLLQTEKLRPSWWGLPLLMGGIALRLFGAYFYYEWFDLLSLIPVTAGACWMLGGWFAVRWSWPAIAFLVFMIPLPHTLEVAMRDPLRGVGTFASTYLMQTIGLPALSQGNVVVVNDVRIGVVEACSGLRMLMVFFALSTAVALVAERALWEKVIVVLSAVPIALISNVMRITLTGVLHVTLAGKTVFGMSGSEFADFVFHDVAGWLMMPFALVLLWLEFRFLSNLFVVEEERPLAAGLSPQTRAKTKDSSARHYSKVANGVPSSNEADCSEQLKEAAAPERAQAAQ